MPDSKGSDLSIPAPFSIRGSSSSFSQRQADIFGGLTALEDAHKKVTEETKAERLLVKKMAWRETKPAVEPLEAVKEARDRAKKEADSPFKVPSLPPPRANKRRMQRGCDRGGYRFPMAQNRDPSKWTFYSLADVDEDARDDRKIAADFFRELRQRRGQQETMEIDSPEKDVHRERILFRPTAGRKRGRFEDFGPSSTPSGATVTAQALAAANDDAVAETDLGDLPSSPPTEVVFRSRNQRQRQRAVRSNLTGGDSDEESTDIKEVSSSSMPEETGSVESGQEDEAEEANDLEDAPEGV